MKEVGRGGVLVLLVVQVVKVVVLSQRLILQVVLQGGRERWKDRRRSSITIRRLCRINNTSTSIVGEE